MARHTARFTPEAKRDLTRLYDFLLERDVAAAARALRAIRQGIDVLRYSPYTCRKVDVAQPRLRELVIPFGSAGYVALVEIEPPRTVTILAIRHQREDDIH